MSESRVEPLLQRLREWGIVRVFGGPRIPAETAAFMAAGHAKLTGEIGACIGGGPRLAAALEDARADRQPVLAIVDEPVPGFESTDHVDRAVRHARDGRVPVCLLPREQRYGRVVPGSRSHVYPLPEELEAAARLLDAGRRVAILAGQGARRAGDVLLRIAEVLGAGIVKTPKGRDVVPDDLPFIGGPELLAACDTLLVVGAKPREMPRRVRIVHVDLEPRLDRPVDALLVGDSGYTLRLLLPLLSCKRSAWWRERVQNPPDGFPLPDGAIVTCDSGDLPPMRFRAGMSFLPGMEGTAVPYAIAASLAQPDRPVLAFAADGPALLNDLRLVAELRSPVTVIVHSAFDYARFAEMLGLPAINVPTSEPCDLPNS